MKRTKSTSQPKLGPGEYRPDTAYTRVEDLPKPKCIKLNRSQEQLACPRCGRPAGRDKVFGRALHDIGDLVAGRPRELHVSYSQHHCSVCAKYFSVDLTDLAPPGGHYTHRVMALAVRAVVEDGLPYRAASWRLWRDHRVFVPFATIQNWVEAGGKKGQ
jgi:transposase